MPRPPLPPGQDLSQPFEQAVAEAQTSLCRSERQLADELTPEGVADWGPPEARRAGAGWGAARRGGGGEAGSVGVSGGAHRPTPVAPLSAAAFKSSAAPNPAPRPHPRPAPAQMDDRPLEVIEGEREARLALTPEQVSLRRRLLSEYWDR